MPNYTTLARSTFTYLLLSIVSIDMALAESDMIKFNGFATLGAIYNDSDDLGFHTNFKTPARSGFSFAPDSLIGAQANISFAPQWDAIVQAVYRDKQDSSVLNYIDVAFLRYKLDSRWEFRAGRMNTDIYFLSEYKSVGYAYLWARPPAEFYSKVTSVSQFEGADIAYKHSLGNGFLQLKAGFGESDARIATTGRAYDIDFTDVLTTSVSYQQDNWQLRASYLSAEVDNFSADLSAFDAAIALFPPSVWPGGPELLDRVSFESKDQQFFGLGYQYDNDLWLVQTELGFIKSDWELERDSVSGYLSIGYQPEGITYFVTVSAIEPTKDNVDDGVGEISPFAPAEVVATIQSFGPSITNLFNQNRTKQHTFSLGTKWQLSASLIAKFQMDYSVIADDGFGIWKVNVQPDSGESVTVTSLNLNWVF